MESSGKSLLSNEQFLRKIFDAIPSVLLIVDDDVRILHLNQAAAKMLEADIADAYTERGGDMLHCINAAATPDGCGHSRNCRECIIRNSVGKALNGESVYRQKTTMKVAGKNNDVTELHLLVSASLFEHGPKSYVLLVLEDISELVQLRGFLSTCSACRKIRDDEGNWVPIEQYVSSHSEARFTHGLCPDCASEIYPEYYKKNEI